MISLDAGLGSWSGSFFVDFANAVWHSHTYNLVHFLEMVFILYIYKTEVALLASLASATAGVASLASHHMATQCLSIIEVIKLSG